MPAHSVPPHLLDRARGLAARGGRRILGVAGAPGAGKSTFAGHLVEALNAPDPAAPLAALVPMDGFHLAGRELDRLGRTGRKGAPDTFDAAGYAALLARLRTPEPDTTVWAPDFDRTVEEAIAGSLPVEPGVPLVVTEGNYLLHDGGHWAGVRPLLDEVWYLETDPGLRVRRLVDRHVRFGRERRDAELWVAGSDEANARLVARGRARADLVITAD
ncbi:nucleoside/nucleotide kinase family protein [Streptomyces genisteinicus]|uniref:Nucleoside/nucleotide kinase family protein n=1 Tax=Streptomyces genisteinicus TaxID=2768068 RepID=A0A7H0HZU5_9ACTN|nr:nucleoside/nucleotide kinase family protein [Streptomyces genisteinicus]QNP66061.1 nucleoside/nucleotide kinase family protein [Streptomyces genisteinicus]